MLETFMSLSAMQVTVLIIGAMLIGINKTAIPGLGVLPVVMLMRLVSFIRSLWTLLSIIQH